MNFAYLFYFIVVSHRLSNPESGTSTQSYFHFLTRAKLEVEG